MKRLCSIDNSYNEKVNAKNIVRLIEPDKALVKVNIIRKNLLGDTLKREKIEHSHILIITGPRKKFSYETYTDLIDYIDVGGSLFLTPVSPSWDHLGRWFSEFMDELGISFDASSIYGIPKIPYNTRVIGTSLSSHSAYPITVNEDKKFMKESGISEYIPLATIDNKTVIVAGEKRRGKFVIFSSLDTLLNESNKDFFNILLRVTSQKKSYSLDDPVRIDFADSQFSFSLQHASLNVFLLSLFHHNFNFYQGIIEYKTTDDLSIQIQKLLEQQKLLGNPPELTKIKEALEHYDFQMD